jgi:hypothetical protein
MAILKPLIFLQIHMSKSATALAVPNQWETVTISGPSDELTEVSSLGRQVTLVDTGLLGLGEATVEKAQLDDVDAFIEEIRALVVQMGEYVTVSWDLPIEETSAWQIKNPTPEQKKSLDLKRWMLTRPSERGPRPE